MASILEKIRLAFEQAQRNVAPSLIDKMREGMEQGWDPLGGYGRMGLPPAQKVGDVVNMLVDVMPGVGDVKSVAEGAEALRKGDYAGAGLGLLGALPFVGGLGALKGAESAAAARDAALRARKAGKISGALKTDPLPAPDTSGYSLFDYSKLDEAPTVEQTPIPRKQGVGGRPTERMADIMEDDYVRKGMDAAVKRGVEYRNWYNITPFEQAWMDANPDPQSLIRFLSHQTIASQRNPVPQQLRSGSYLWHLDQQGLLTPDADIQMPKGYGSLAQKQIIADSKKLAGGQPLDPLKSPKRVSYVNNWFGNQLPVTVDTHGVRLPGMLSHDPRWLAESVGDTGARRAPKKEWEAGDLQIADAVKQPGLWEAAPTGSEYGMMEKMWQDVARKNGVRPAQAQAMGWVGGGNVTGLKSRPQLFLQAVEDRIQATAKARGMSPTEVIRRLAKGEIYLD